MTLRYYVSGPMRGIPEFNFPAFDAACEFLRSAGIDAINPADHDRAVDPECVNREGFATGTPGLNTHPGMGFHELMRWDLEQIADPYCNGIVLLDGWENSTGAKMELKMAVELGKEVWRLVWQADGWWWDKPNMNQVRRAIADVELPGTYEQVPAPPGLISDDKQARKERPMARGCLDYFPDALAEVAHVSLVANEQHNPGEPLHWAKEKSTDEADALLRHLVDRGKIDNDGLRHSAKVAWRGLALLQREIDAERERLAFPEKWGVALPESITVAEGEELMREFAESGPRDIIAEADPDLERLLREEEEAEVLARRPFTIGEWQERQAIINAAPFKIGDIVRLKEDAGVTRAHGTVVLSGIERTLVAWPEGETHCRTYELELVGSVR